MASRPGILTEWPWTWLGDYKYAVIAPWVLHSTYSYMVKDKSQRDLGSLIIFPFLLTRILHNQLWISFSRYRTAKGTNRIVNKNIEFEQVDRERNWDDQIIFNGLLFYLGHAYIKEAHHLPWWRTDGVIWTILLHAGPVEFLYYWLHRALHHHYLYSRYHSHHHSSIVTEPITCYDGDFSKLVYRLHAVGIQVTYFHKSSICSHCNDYCVREDNLQPTHLFNLIEFENDTPCCRSKEFHHLLYVDGNEYKYPIT